MEKGDLISPITVASWLKNLAILDGVGGLAYLESLVGKGTPVDSDVLFYRNELAELASIRIMALAGKDVFEMGDKSGVSQIMRSILSDSMVMHQSSDSVSAHDVVSRILRDFWQKKHKRLAHSGLFALDELLYGFHPSSMYTIMARMSVGKTSLLSWIALQAANAGFSFSYVTADMSPEALIERMLSTLSGVDLSTIMRWVDVITEVELTKFYDAAQRLDALPIYFIYVKTTQIDDAIQALRREKIVHHTDIAGLDYLQLFSDKRAESHTVELDGISHKLKALTLELDIPLIAAIAANRGSVQEKRGVGVGDVRGSDSIAYDSDVMITLDDMDERMDSEGNVLPEGVKRVKVRVAKSRNGRTGEVICKFDGRYQRWACEVQT